MRNQFWASVESKCELKSGKKQIIRIPNNKNLNINKYAYPIFILLVFIFNQYILRIAQKRVIWIIWLLYHRQIKKCNCKICPYINMFNSAYVGASAALI